MCLEVGRKNWASLTTQKGIPSITIQYRREPHGISPGSACFTYWHPSCENQEASLVGTLRQNFIFAVK